jgi:hypothetical protein
MSFFSEFNKNREILEKCDKILQDGYSNSQKSIYIESIIKGEYMEIKDGNVLVDKHNYEDDDFDEKLKLCKLHLYDYQINAIKKIREIELEGFIETIFGGEVRRITTNVAHLNLQIGSGKSVVFLFLALFYREVPCLPIIMSTNPFNLPETEMLQFKNYPFYFENGAYESGTNCVQVLKDYQQRRITVLITHFHLLEQMRTYLRNDFAKSVTNSVNIQTATNTKDINWAKVELAIIPSSAENMKHLCSLSFSKPFMRIIVDDYTSMSDIGTFRQVLASFTLFVSGTGFDRDEKLIPTSYYTLKGLGCIRPCISLVANPDEIAKGIFRDNISMNELVGSACEFEQYEFINKVEEGARQSYKMDAVELYPVLKGNPYIQHYFSLMWLMSNFDKLRVIIYRVGVDLEEKKISEGQIKFFNMWKREFAIARDVVRRVNTKGKVGSKEIHDITYNSPLFENLLTGEDVESRKISTTTAPILMQKCMNCLLDSQYHYGFGMISLCCGAFYCKNCLRAMTTRSICISNGGSSREIKTADSYWCCSCREENPRFYLNSSKMKDKNVYSYVLVDEYCVDSEKLVGSIKFDYWFYMFKYGLVPKFHEGKKLYVGLSDVEFIGKGGSGGNDNVKNLVGLYPKDQLGLKILYYVNEILKELKMIPKKGTKAIFFAVPAYLQNRVHYVYNEICRGTFGNSNGSGKKKKGELTESECPIKNFELVFRDNAESLIGAHQMTQLMIVWKGIKNQDEFLQCISRIIRLNSWQIPLYFLFILTTMN